MEGRFYLSLLIVASVDYYVKRVEQLITKCRLQFQFGDTHDVNTKDTIEKKFQSISSKINALCKYFKNSNQVMLDKHVRHQYST